MMDQGGQCSVPKGEGRAIWIPFFTTQWLEDFTTGPAHDATENRFFKAWQNLPSGVSLPSRWGTEAILPYPNHRLGEF